jgi:protoporphyrinogen oxidase
LDRFYTGIMSTPTVVVLGGGMSGVAAAYTLAASGFRHVTLLESGASLGGLAGSFERDGHFYPLGYHHILHRDRTLLFFLDLIGALPSVRWRRIRMAFRIGGQLHDLGTPLGFLRFPLVPADKVRFMRLMLHSFTKNDWSDWADRNAAELIDKWAGPAVRKTIFEKLTMLKFELPCDEVSAAWMGARLHFREGSAPLGHIPHANWTKVLCDGVTRLLNEIGVHVRFRTSVVKLHGRAGRVREAELIDGQRVSGDLFVSTVPALVYRGLLPDDQTPNLASIQYTALISVVCATRQNVEPEFYWINLTSLDRTACGIFLLSALNPTIGGPGETCVNFVTHLRDRDRPLFAVPDTELLARYLADFREVFGLALEPFWINVARMPMYSPVFHPSFKNVPVRSTSWSNVYFAGNYRTFPSIASTGTALQSGIESAQVILREHGLDTNLPSATNSFRLRSMPRG